MKMISLFDKTGHMAMPWAEAGYECLVVDLQHPEGIHPHPHIPGVWTMGADMRTWTPPREWVEGVAFIAASPRAITWPFPAPDGSRARGCGSCLSLSSCSPPLPSGATGTACLT